MNLIGTSVAFLAPECGVTLKSRLRLDSNKLKLITSIRGDVERIPFNESFIKSQNCFWFFLILAAAYCLFAVLLLDVHFHEDDVVHILQLE